MIVGFNTGRMYTAAGQRISARVLDGGVVVFQDHDRMILGELEARWGLDRPYGLERFVYTEYLHNRYRMSFEPVDAGSWPAMRM